MALSGALATGDALVRGVTGVVGVVGGVFVVVIVGVVGVVVGGCCCRCGWVGGLVASEAAVMRRVSSLRRLGLPLAPRIGRCPCPHRPLSSAAEPEALADANPVQDLALSKGKMKRTGNRSEKIRGRTQKVAGKRIKGKKYGGPLPDYSA